ncbi:MAG TPA: YetF domain-containing protein, partial [Polyangiales bacterium]
MLEGLRVPIVSAARKSVGRGASPLCGEWLDGEPPPALQAAAIRGSRRPLVRDGQIDFGALEDEALSPDDLMAGLRKLGYATPDVVLLAVLEET